MNSLVHSCLSVEHDTNSTRKGSVFLDRSAGGKQSAEEEASKMWREHSRKSLASVPQKISLVLETISIPGNIRTKRKPSARCVLIIEKRRENGRPSKRSEEEKLSIPSSLSSEKCKNYVINLARDCATEAKDRREQMYTFRNLKEKEDAENLTRNSPGLDT